ncbi:MAG: hypothetical protein KAV87_08640 [Desulfobacteraceae bacterium]|nr:hypothetical protein [Desulfobacteraceae bacterium]
MSKKKRHRSKNTKAKVWKRQRQRRSGRHLNNSGGVPPRSLGFDYGVRPHIMSVANLDFLNLWNKAKCIAMAYTVIPQLGLRANLPMAGMVFERFDFAEELFKLMNSWMSPPCNESAVDIYFIEDKKQNDYHLVIGTNMQQLLLRTFGEDSVKDYLTLGIVAYICKKFPLSNYFKTFRELVRNNSAFVCPLKAESYPNALDGTSITVPVSDNQIGFSVGFVKSDIRFLEKESIAPESQEHFLVDLIDKKKPNKERPSGPSIPTSEDVKIQRTKQIKRFFPVTTARLPYNHSFNSAKEKLISKYAEWQIVQGACNIFARANWPEYGYGEKTDMIQIYQKLRTSTQDATEEATLTFEFTPRALEKQIRLDMQYLHSYVCPNSKAESQIELKSKGYI